MLGEAIVCANECTGLKGAGRDGTNLSDLPLMSKRAQYQVFSATSDVLTSHLHITGAQDFFLREFNTTTLVNK